MKNGGGYFAPKLGGHFELESGVTLNWNWVVNITRIYILHLSAYYII